MAERRPFTEDDLKVIFIRAQKPTGEWTNVSVYEASVTQLTQWLETIMGILVTPNKPWTVEERINILERIRTEHDQETEER